MNTTRILAAHASQIPASMNDRGDAIQVSIYSGSATHELSPASSAGRDGPVDAFRARLRDWSGSLRPRNPVESYLLERAVRLSIELDHMDACWQAVAVDTQSRGAGDVRRRRIGFVRPSPRSNDRTRRDRLACGRMLAETLETLIRLQRSEQRTDRDVPPDPLGGASSIRAGRRGSTRSAPPAPPAMPEYGIDDACIVAILSQIGSEPQLAEPDESPDGRSPRTETAQTKPDEATPECMSGVSSVSRSRAARTKPTTGPTGPVVATGHPPQAGIARTKPTSGVARTDEGRPLAPRRCQHFRQSFGWRDGSDWPAARGGDPDRHPEPVPTRTATARGASEPANVAESTRGRRRVGGYEVPLDPSDNSSRADHAPVRLRGNGPPIPASRRGAGKTP